MNHAALIIAVTAIAGLALGTLSTQRHRDAAHLNGARLPSQTSEPANYSGSGDARDMAFGAALTELRQTDNDLPSLARLGTALTQLDSNQIATLLNRFEHDDAGRFDDRLAWLFAWWLKRDPAAAHAWVRPRLDAATQDGPTLGLIFEMSARGRLILAWAKADPHAAVEFARSHPRAGVSTELLRTAMSAWPDSDYRRRIELLLGFPAGIPRATALYELHRSWAYREPAAAFASAQGLEPGRERDKAISEILARWSERDGAAAFAQYRALGLSDSPLLSKILASTAAKNPAQAAAWLTQLDATQIARCAPKMVEAWAEHDPASALNWALANRIGLSAHDDWTSRIEHDGFTRSQSGSSRFVSPLGKALEKQPEATLAWLHSLAIGSERQRITELAVGACGNLDQALSLFATLPAEAGARTARGVAMRFGDDPERGREWAMSLPDGPTRTEAWAGLGFLAEARFDPPPRRDRDAFLSGTLHRSGRQLMPEEKLATMLQIGDPVLRRDMVDEVMEDYMESQPDEARAALEKAPVPEEWKRRWRTPE